MGLNTEQIIQAMYCCCTDEGSCLTCPFQKDYDSCVGLNKLAHSELKRLNEENERLRAENNIYSNNVERIAENYHRQGRADTVRELQKRFTKAICDNTYPDFNREGKPVNVWKATTGYDVLDQIAKEMLEENNERIKPE